MDVQDTRDYDKVKQAILTKFEIDLETYRHRFRSLMVIEGETARELQARLTDLYQKWMCPGEKTKVQIGDAIVLEQFFRMLNPELKVWVKERNPQSSKEAADLAEAFLAARQQKRRAAGYFSQLSHVSRTPL
uniref:SCAN box domain-containing protein n=1 Tax=Paramormyrops kingsleyae TaxID=1676925 RepID=A0A3B3R0B7_9TELE